MRGWWVGRSVDRRLFNWFDGLLAGCIFGYLHKQIVAYRYVRGETGTGFVHDIDKCHFPKDVTYKQKQVQSKFITNKLHILKAPYTPTCYRQCLRVISIPKRCLQPSYTVILIEGIPLCFSSHNKTTTLWSQKHTTVVALGVGVARGDKCASPQCFF